MLNYLCDDRDPPEIDLHTEAAGLTWVCGFRVASFLAEGAAGAEGREATIGSRFWRKVAVHAAYVVAAEGVDVGPRAAVEEVPAEHVGCFVPTARAEVRLHDVAKGAVVTAADVAADGSVLKATKEPAAPLAGGRQKDDVGQVESLGHRRRPWHRLPRFLAWRLRCRHDLRAAHGQRVDLRLRPHRRTGARRRRTAASVHVSTVARLIAYGDLAVDAAAVEAKANHVQG